MYSHLCAQCIKHAYYDVFASLLVEGSCGCLLLILQTVLLNHWEIKSQGYKFIYGILHRYNDGLSKSSPRLDAHFTLQDP